MIKTTAEESHKTSAAFLRLSDYRRMTIDIEFLLARHPLLFFGWECRIKGFDSSSVLTAIGDGGRNIHPLFAVKSARYKLADEKCCWEVAVTNKAHVLLFTAYKSTTNVVARIAELLPLIFGSNAKRPEGKHLL